MVTSERLTFADIYNENPDVLDENPEFLLNLFEDATTSCRERSQPLTMKNVFYHAKVTLLNMQRDEYRQHYALVVSLSEPSIEIYRWFPQIADKLGIDSDLKPLWDYVEPSVLMALNIHLWNSAYSIIQAVPEYADKLKAKNKKPPITLLDYGDERGLVAVVIDDNDSVVIKGTVHSGEESIAKEVSGIVGPKVIESNQGWIVEEFLNGIPIEDLLVDHPDIIGAALGVALRKTHSLGLAYLDRFDRKHTLIDPVTKKVSLIDWSSAVEGGDQSNDLRNAKTIMTNWFASDQISLSTALTNFKSAYVVPS